MKRVSADVRSSVTEVAVSEPKSVVSSSERIMGLSRIDTPLTDGRAINVEGDALHQRCPFGISESFES